MAESIKYFTLANSGEGFYKERGSKFYAHAYRVDTEDEIKERLEELRKIYHDARHHCYAFQLGLSQPIIRANDDGEPNHSAGDPILGQIRSFGLTNVLVVVIRYFGGTKLGVGGLITAYKTAAFEALNGLELEEIVPLRYFSIEYSYEETPVIERLMKQFELFEIKRVFEQSCQLMAGIRPEYQQAFKIFCKDVQLDLTWRDQD